MTRLDLAGVEVAYPMLDERVVDLSTRIRPATLLADVPSSFPTAEEGVVYTPRNYDNRYRGPLLVRQALAGSVNVPAVAALPGIAELHIGHSIIARAVFVGLRAAVRQMKDVIETAAGRP